MKLLSSCLTVRKKRASKFYLPVVVTVGLGLFVGIRFTFVSPSDTGDFSSVADFKTRSETPNFLDHSVSEARNTAFLERERQDIGRFSITETINSDQLEIESGKPKQATKLVQHNKNLPESRVLQPGGGWNGPTLQPAPINPNDQFGDAKAIARWDVVPYQDFSGLFEIGVVAFHINGIDRVEFAVEGGDWINVSDMTLNRRTGVWEYTTSLDASLFEDGLVEVRAKVYPREAGEVRVLAGEIEGRSGQHSMFLNANAGGSWGAGEVFVANSGNDKSGDGSRNKPFASIWRAMQSAPADADGLHVRLAAGDYKFGGDRHPRPITKNGWITIEPAKGVNHDDVRLVGGGRFRTKLVRFRDVLFDHREESGGIGRFDHLEPEIWLDGVLARADGRTAELVSGIHFAQAYMTDVELSGYRDGAEGQSLSRNVHLSKLGSDAFGDSGLVINSSVDDIAAPKGSGFHPDVFQFSGRGRVRDNTIVYGLRATNVKAQGIFADDLSEVTNSAFVNVLIDASSHKSQWKDVSTNHLLLWHVSLIDQPFAWRTTALRNISVMGCLFERMEGRDSIPVDASILHNHIATFSGTFGEDLTTGDVVLDATMKDGYIPLQGSPLLNRMPNMLVPAYSDGQLRDATQFQVIGSETPGFVAHKAKSKEINE